MMESIGKMSSLSLFSIIFVVFIKISLLKVSLCVEVQIVEGVMNKLDRYAADKTDSSFLTIHDLRAATEQYMGWDDRHKDSFKRRYHQVKLLEDFLFIPLSRNLCNFIAESAEKTKCDEDMEIESDFVHRFELFYKEFKPAYQGRMIGNEYASGRKTNILVGTLLNLKNHKTNSLTKEMFLDAAKEYRAYVKRIEDITKHEDIFACSEELRLQLNYLNKGEVKLLAERIFPLLENGPVWIDQNLDSLKSDYKTEFDKLSDLKIIDGQIVKLVRV